MGRKNIVEIRNPKINKIDLLSNFNYNKMRDRFRVAAPVAQWIERLFPKQKVTGSTPVWREVVHYNAALMKKPFFNFLIFHYR